MEDKVTKIISKYFKGKIHYFNLMVFYLYSFNLYQLNLWS